MMRVVIFAGLLLGASHAVAGDIVISEAWARATAPGQESGAVYMSLSSRVQARITAVSSPQAESAMFHSTINENNVVKMRELSELALPAGKQVDLKPGGLHLMLGGLKQPLRVDEEVTIALTAQFEGGRTEQIRVNVKVKPIAGKHEHHHDH